MYKLYELYARETPATRAASRFAWLTKRWHHDGAIRRVKSLGVNIIGAIPSRKLGRMVRSESLLERAMFHLLEQGSTGEQPAADAAAHGIRLEVVTLPEAKRGFVLVPRRWVVERDCA